MKRTIIVIIFVSLISLVGCKQTSAHLYETMLEEKPLHVCNPVYVYVEGDLYSVIVYEGNIKCAARFSAKREVLDTFNISLSSMDSVEAYLGKTLTDLQNEFGSYHTDIGSGLFIPSYILVDGYLACFTIIDGIVTNASRVDLLSGEPIEWYNLEDNESKISSIPSCNPNS